MARADVIVVLGAAVKPGGLPSKTLTRRVLHAVRLYKEGCASKILMTGGLGQHAPSEAEVMKSLALGEGIPAQDILLEPVGRNTLDSAKRCLAIINQQGWRQIIVVTDDFHLRRAMRVFEALGANVPNVQGIQGSGSSTASQFSPWKRAFYYVRDWIASIWYIFLLLRESKRPHPRA